MGQNQDTYYSLHDGILLWRGCVVIPKSLQPAILQELHVTHTGISKMKSIARAYVYWTNINQDIVATSQICKQCADHQKNPQKASLHHWEETSEPFQCIHMDYAQLHKDYFLIIIDAHTKWLEVYTTKTEPTSEITIKFFKEFFSRFGLPEQLVSDLSLIHI